MYLPFDAFIRSVSVNSDVKHAFFLGAGASISSNIPSASMCIWQWKHEIFVTGNQDIARLFTDVSLPNTRRRIQEWLETQGSYPELGSAEEYGFYAEACYPIPADRRQFFQNLVRKASPSVGYKLLVLLSQSGLVESVWSTNFDSLTSRAAAGSTLAPIEVGLDTPERAMRLPRENELLCVSLHGDYRYDSIKNTTEELRTEDSNLRQRFVEYLADRSLIVVGYSGRDKSVMDTLEAAYSHHGSGRLYWCGRDAVIPHPAVADLLHKARQSGRDAYYVSGIDFDELLIRMSLQILEGDLLARANELRREHIDLGLADSPPFTVRASGISGVIKTNAFPIECPREALSFESDLTSTAGAWKRLRSLTRHTQVSAVPYKRRVLALGSLEGVRRVFSGHISGAIETQSITPLQLGQANGAVVSLLTTALVRSIAETLALGSDNRSLLWEEGASNNLMVDGLQRRVHSAVVVRLRRYGGSQFLVISPTLVGTDSDGNRVDSATDNEIRRRLLTRQYNKDYNSELERWRALLFKSRRTFRFPLESEPSAEFSLRSSPAFAKISSESPISVDVPKKFLRLMQFSGTQFREPLLQFSNSSGTGTATDVNPIRGLIQNNPYDFALTVKGLQQTVRLGVVCPAKDAATLRGFLNRLHDRQSPDSKTEYVVEYPGFSIAFKLPLDIPSPNRTGWNDLVEPEATGAGAYIGEELAREIVSSIESLSASSSPSVILVYIPQRWGLLENTAGRYGRFDLHDFIKAYCVSKGLASQLLREETIAKTGQCEIMWWLASALYVKSMRTPWIVQAVDSDTAFMGIGFSVDQTAVERERTVLGCSHIYDSEGLGLRYRLAKIDEAIVRGRNAFMSFDDARRMAENARQMYFEAKMRMPERVVIHKRTPFQHQERAGLLEGLSGIDSIDMLEITIDPALRGIASRYSSHGKFEGDGFPVRRGSAVVLDYRRALLWVHGTTEATDPRKRYYLGKSRIPAPLLIKRHYGESDLGTIATEVLGLSKMNWNTLDLYAKLPATVNSATEISRIGRYLETYGPMSYDYRLFI